EGDDSGLATVNYNVAGYGASPVDAADFPGVVLPSGTLSFATGETAKILTINVAGDVEVEPNESFILTLSNPVGAELGASSVTAIVNNDDSAAAVPIIVLSTSSLTHGEGASGNTAYAFTATRTGDTTGASSVGYSVAGSGVSPAAA